MKEQATEATKIRVRNWSIWESLLVKDKLDYPSKSNIASATRHDIEPYGIPEGMKSFSPVEDVEFTIEPAMSQLKKLEPKQYEVVRMDMADNGLSVEEKAKICSLPVRTYTEIRRKTAYITIEWILDQLSSVEKVNAA